MSASDNLSGQFDPHTLRKGDEVEVPTAALTGHTGTWFDERDPDHGGRSYTDIDKLGQSMRSEGQQEPIILSKQPDDTFWVAEGNHRIAAALRHDIGTLKVTRGGDYAQLQRGEGIESTASRLGPRPEDD